MISYDKFPEAPPCTEGKNGPLKLDTASLIQRTSDAKMTSTRVPSPNKFVKLYNSVVFSP